MRHGAANEEYRGVDLFQVSLKYAGSIHHRWILLGLALWGMENRLRVMDQGSGSWLPHIPQHICMALLWRYDAGHLVLMSGVGSVESICVENPTQYDQGSGGNGFRNKS
jgi:hypothetical protein